MRLGRARAPHPTRDVPITMCYTEDGFTITLFAGTITPK
jgi:hypothetical protein